MIAEDDSSGIEERLNVDGTKSRGIPKDHLVRSLKKKMIVNPDEMDTLLAMEYIALVDVSYRPKNYSPVQ